MHMRAKIRQDIRTICDLLHVAKVELSDSQAHAEIKSLNDIGSRRKKLSTVRNSTFATSAAADGMRVGLEMPLLRPSFLALSVRI
jgi:hypothetical protein